MLGAAISKLLVVLCLFRPLIGIAQAFYPHATLTTRTRQRHQWEHGRWVAAGIEGGGSLGVGNNKHVPCCFGDGASLRSVSAEHSSSRRNARVAVFMTSSGGGDNDPHNSSTNGGSDDMLFGEAALLVALSVVTTTLVVATLYSLSTNPFVDFDVDLFLSINRALSSGSSTIGGGGVADGVMGGGEIVELPALSPAEQIVGAFFGPPRR